MVICVCLYRQYQIRYINVRNLIENPEINLHSSISCQKTFSIYIHLYNLNSLTIAIEPIFIEFNFDYGAKNEFSCPVCKHLVSTKLLRFLNIIKIRLVLN